MYYNAVDTPIDDWPSIFPENVRTVLFFCVILIPACDP